MTIQPEPLQRNCPLDNGRLQPSTARVSASPSTSCELVDSVPEYNSIVKHCPDALRALLSTRMAVHFTASHIFEALRKESCFVCGKFGSFLDMFTAQRCCFDCLASSDSLLSMTATSARKEFGLDLKMMRTIPTLLSIPGEYSESGRTYRRRTRLVRMLSVSAAKSHHHDTDNLHQRPVPSTTSSLQPSEPRPIRNSHPSLQKFDAWFQNPHRFMPMLRFPSLDRRSGKLDWGVSCQACHHGPRDESRGYCDWNTVYSTSGYIDHFQKCEVSQRARAEIPQLINHDGDFRNRNDLGDQFVSFLSNFEL
ncbi:hypothetical protein sscle_02g018770 [Sclerotinia sclerotiorum 1980 UF-70]|uniref:Uncharacterized protein n=1 Tax=Sclerotinia sclerotiorum (strain ATCC 18683 / 1980 / Ss-1) TaxID=665079 RepID=A0A1D9PWN5_SCLS1|nr:hypothetical protein sscle_02g018770 [Sclerotinia sclerotiorum 1980 UF-70]